MIFFILSKNLLIKFGYNTAMKNSKNNVSNLPSPAYVCELELLEKNLKLLERVQEEADIKILLDTFLKFFIN